MLIRFVLAVIIIPFVELVLLLRMADATSWLFTLAIVVGTGVLGLILARRQGLAAFARCREAVAAGRMPGREIQDGMMVAFAAALLLTPGLISDTLGFLLLTPWGRHRVGDFLRRRYAGKFRVQTAGFGQQMDRDSSHDSEPSGPTSWRGGNEGHSSGYTVDAPSFGPKQRQPN